MVLGGAPLCYAVADTKLMDGAMQSVILYMHIPKAGGSAINDWVYRSFRANASGVETKFFRSGVFYYPSGFIKHVEISQRIDIQSLLVDPALRAVVGHFRFGIHEFISRSSRYSTILRDPVERVVSLYYFQRLVQQRYGSHDGVIIPNNLSLKQFSQNAPYKEVDNGQVRRISGSDPDIGRCDLEMLEMAKRHLCEYFEVVGTTERVEDFIGKLKHTHDVSRKEVLYWRNVNPFRPRMDDIPVRDKLAIVKSNELDVELYEFAKRLSCG